MPRCRNSRHVARIHAQNDNVGGMIEAMSTCRVASVVAVIILCALVAARQLHHDQRSANINCTARGPINCERVVNATKDDYPIRSPQAVHSAIASIVCGHDLVEIGTRHGDGMACFARYARTAFAIEKEPEYCAMLRARSKGLGGGGNFQVACKGYEDVHLDADYYTWWTQAPFLANAPALLHLRKGQLAGKIRANATALVLLAHGEAEEHRRSDLLQLAAWKVAVPFAEHREKRWGLMFPEKGTWHVLGVPLSAVDVDKVSEWPHLNWGNEVAASLPEVKKRHGAESKPRAKNATRAVLTAIPNGR